MHDLNPFERRLFDWLSRRSDRVLFVLPIAVFLLAAGLGVAVVSAIAQRSPLADAYALWVIDAVVLAGLLLYLLSIESLGACFVRTGRFRLLELHRSMRDIRAMSWRQFEDLVAAVYQAQGYDIEPRGGDTPDGGIDLVVRKGGLRWIVQCKHYRDQWVGVRPLRELLGVVSAQRATGGVFVTSGVFDEQALEFAKDADRLELIAGEQLGDLIRDLTKHGKSEVTCPRCGSPMRERTGRYGPFLGCSNFPSCHGAMPIPREAAR